MNSTLLSALATVHHPLCFAALTQPQPNRQIGKADPPDHEIHPMLVIEPLEPCPLLAVTLHDGLLTITATQRILIRGSNGHDFISPSLHALVSRCLRAFGLYTSLTATPCAARYRFTSPTVYFPK